MRFYAHYGHKDFILCLGLQGEMIRRYFLEYNEAFSSDFVLTRGCRDIQLRGRDLDVWRVTFIDSGANSHIGVSLVGILALYGHIQGSDCLRPHGRKRECPWMVWRDTSAPPA